MTEAMACERPVVAKGLDLGQHLRLFRPPVKDEGDHTDVARGSVTLAQIEREWVRLEPGVGGGQVLGDDQTGMRACSLGLEHERLHRAALHIESLRTVHRPSSCKGFRM